MGGGGGAGGAVTDCGSRGVCPYSLLRSVDTRSTVPLRSEGEGGAVFALVPRLQNSRCLADSAQWGGVKAKSLWLTAYGQRGDYGSERGRRVSSCFAGRGKSCLIMGV